MGKRKPIGQSVVAQPLSREEILAATPEHFRKTSQLRTVKTLGELRVAIAELPAALDGLPVEGSFNPGLVVVLSRVLPSGRFVLSVREPEEFDGE